MDLQGPGRDPHFLLLISYYYGRGCTLLSEFASFNIIINIMFSELESSTIIINIVCSELEELESCIISAELESSHMINVQYVHSLRAPIFLGSLCKLTSCWPPARVFRRVRPADFGLFPRENDENSCKKSNITLRVLQKSNC